MKKSTIAYLLALAIVFAGCKKDDTNTNGEVTVDDNPTDGQIVLSTYTTPLTGASKLLILDKDGNTLFEKATPVAAINLTKWQVNGRVRYSYMEYDSSAFKITTTGSINPCTAVVLNDNFSEIKRLRLLPYNGRTASDPNAVDTHEFIYLDDNHFITLSYFQKPVNNIPASLNPIANCKVVAPIIQEVQNDAVVWEWDGSKYPEFYQQSVESNQFNKDTVHDYMHVNSIFIDPTDNNLICSIRHTNQVVKISHSDGHIIWRLGGTNSTFPLSAANKFVRQHHATLTNNNQTLLLVDNGDINERNYSRIMEFHFANSQQLSIDSTKSFTLPQGIFAQYMGSVQKRGDTYFIGCGSTPKILEVNYKTNKINFMMTLNGVSYRAQKG